MKKHLVLIPFLAITSLPCRGQEAARSIPCRCTTVRKSITPVETRLQYFPEQNNGQGCVVSGKDMARPAPQGGGIAPSYEPARFVLQFINRSGTILKHAGGDSSVRKLTIYRHVKRDGKLYDELQQTLSSTGAVPQQSHDVANEAVIQSIYFVWPDGFSAASGDYVARLTEPSKVEVPFTLVDDRRGKPIPKKP